MRSLSISVAVCALAGFAAAQQTVPTFTINTFAGNGTEGLGGDGGPPITAEFSLPFGITMANGNMYIADQVNNRARYISNGNTSTLAGTGAASYAGDGGAATRATLNEPTGVAVDNKGNLYISDTLNFVVRIVNPSGTINTFAGNNSLGYGYSGDGAAATGAQLYAPAGLALDASGNLYIADSANNVIREVSGGNINTIAGNSVPDYAGDNGPATAAELNNPTALAFDKSGNLYIADMMNDCIRVITTDGNIHTFAGNGTPGYSGDGGAATSAQLFHPNGVAVDTAGNVYIADSLNSVVRIVTPSGIIATIAGTAGLPGYTGDGGLANVATLNYPTGLTFDGSGNLYVSDTDNNVVRELTPTGSTTPAAALPTIASGGAYSLQDYGQFTSVAPGSWIEIHGTNLAASTQLWNTADFDADNVGPTTLNGTQVFLGAQALNVEYVSSSQINAVVPSTIGSGPQQLTVSTATGKSSPYAITVNTVQPGLLAPSTFNIGGTQYVVALFPDGNTYVLPPNSISGVTSRPAHAGDTIILYGIGFGPVTPSVSAGQIASGPNQLDLPVEFLFGQSPATVAYAGLAPDAVGLYQFNLVVPNVSSTTPIPLTFTLGSVTGAQTLYISVQ